MLKLSPTIQRMSELSGRWRVAGEWDHLLELAEATPVKTRWRVRPLTRRIRAARPEIERLTATLYSLEPVNPQGVAVARRLVRDGTGPVYDPHSGRSLLDEVGRAIAALDPSRPAEMPYGASDDEDGHRRGVRSHRVPGAASRRPARHRQS
jgi:hypothetical protein